MERSLFKPFLRVAGVMVLSIFALAFTVGVEFDFVPGIVMDMPESLKGGWIGNELRCCHNKEKCAKNFADASFYVRELAIPDICPDCGEKLHNMSLAEYEALPKDTEFVKSAFTNDAGQRVFTSVVLSGTARDSIHRPQRCLRGQGNSVEREYTMEIPMEGRKPLKVRVMHASRMLRTATGDEVPYYSYFAYWFVGQDKETCSHYARMFWLAWDRVINSKAHRWGYISVAGVRDPEDASKHEAEIKDFVAQMYPHILADHLREVLY
jgi:hypothetical protein